VTLTVRVITPDQMVWDASGDEVILPATSGQLGILTGHAPLLTALGTGVMRIKNQGKWFAIAIMGGFAEVENDEVTILVNRAERGEGVDLEAAQATRKTAADTLERSTDKLERMQAKQDQQRAVALLQAAEMMSKS
jgi:F-type H+-transporting ATPase subunit epsilon